MANVALRTLASHASDVAEDYFAAMDGKDAAELGSHCGTLSERQGGARGINRSVMSKSALTSKRNEALESVLEQAAVASGKEKKLISQLPRAKWRPILVGV